MFEKITLRAMLRLVDNIFWEMIKRINMWFLAIYEIK